MPPLYTPLSHPHKEIRLLTLAPTYTLTTYPIAIAPPFTALSYVWGSPTDTTPITINNTTVHVTKTLATALRNLRKTLATPLWADAICINQSSLPERTHQVQIMHEIYSLARSVVVYLGSGTKYTDFAMDKMADETFRDRLQRSFDDRTPSREEVMADVVFKHDLCKRPWWRRLWVRQEFILSSGDPVFGCGDRFIKWSELLECFTSLPRSWDYPGLEGLWAECRKDVTGREDDAPGTDGIHLISLDMIRDESRTRGGLDLFTAVRYVLRNSRATNPLDYVYGLLGVLREEERRRIRVDYGVARMELFTKVMEILWTEERGSVVRELLPLLEFCPDGDGFPSWVPDFAAQPVRGWKDYRCLMADGVLEWPEGMTNTKTSENHLVIHGIIFDQVKVVLPTPDAFEQIEELVPVLRQVETAMREGVELDIPSNHRLRSLETLKFKEGVVHTLTRSAVEHDEPLFPGLEDSEVLDAFLGRSDLDFSDLGSWDSGVDSQKPMFHRLTRLLRAKFVARRALITETGFVGIGVRQITQGDVVTFPFGGNAPLVLRPRGNGWAIVGSAYVSGLMEPDRLKKFIDTGLLEPVKFGIL
ncbi:hypothetical protein OQA88_1088 [Cercophora sp. LCS_1]